MRGRSQLFEDAIGRELAVAQLGALVLRDCADDRADPLEDALDLGRGQALRRFDVEQRLDAGRGLVRVLAAGPLERENRKATSDRIDSLSMAAILLDVDGVLHVSGAPIPGAVDAVKHLRTAGHRIRFVTNSTMMSRAQLAAQLRGMGFAIDDEELQTTAVSRRGCWRASACSP